jgi:hypothetical protein
MDSQIEQYRKNQKEKYMNNQNKQSNKKEKNNVLSCNIKSSNQNLKINITNNVKNKKYENSDDSDEYEEVWVCEYCGKEFIEENKCENHEKYCNSKHKNTKNGSKKKQIPSTIKRLVWNKYIGENIGKNKCYCCKLTDITQLSFHCGHVISEHNGGKIDIDNLRPICQNCNSSMGTKNMDDFINEYKIHK